MTQKLRCVDCGEVHPDVTRRQPNCPDCLGLRAQAESEDDFEVGPSSNLFDDPETLDDETYDD